MKTVSFLCNTWRKKDKKSSTKSISSPEGDEDHSSSTSLTKTTFFDEPPTLTLQFDPSRSPDTGNTVPSNDRDQKLFSSRIEKLEPSQVHFRLNGALFNFSHGPPHNPHHGPPNFNRRHPGLNNGKHPLRPSTAPCRPPRPPSPNLYSHTPNQYSDADVSRSPNHIKFAPAPFTRPQHFGSPASHPSFRHIGQPKTNKNINEGLSDELDAVLNPEEIDSLSGSEGRGPPDGTPKSHRRTRSKYFRSDENRTLSNTTTTQPNSPLSSLKGSPSTSYATLDRSDFSSPHGLYHSTSSTSHLPYTERAPTHSIIGSSGENNPKSQCHTSDFPFALFPSPPPLVIRKRPKPLILLPTPTLARLPPSPAFSTTDSSLPVTPASPGVYTQSLSPLSPRQPRSTVCIPKSTPGRPLHSISPPTYSPPDSPLPNPPSPKETAAPPVPRKVVVRALRTTQSTSVLRSEGSFNSSSTHRATLSTPSHVDVARRRINPPPGILDAPSYLVSREQTVSVPLIESQIQWGYAV